MEHVLTLFTSPAAWRSAMIRSSILVRLMRRYAAAGDAEGDDACARLLASAPTEDARKPLLAALERRCAGEAPAVDPVLSRAICRLADREPLRRDFDPAGRTAG